LNALVHEFILLAPTDKPSPPRDVRVKEVNKDYVVVTWDAPESDGGSPITGYLVEKKDAAKKTYIKADNTDANTLELKVTKLVEGKEYDIRVFAENEIGASEPAALPKPVKARLPFGE
jgi:titin